MARLGLIGALTARNRLRLVAFSPRRPILALRWGRTAMAKSSAFEHIKENLVLYGALTANLGIAIAKFVAAAITGSSSMLTEGVHSLVDSFNQLLLLYGQSRAKKPPDRTHPFGYGRELYFWAFVVAMLIFSVGAGVSIYEGWKHVSHPEPLRSPIVNYLVLGIALVLEGGSWVLAVREMAAERGTATWWQLVKRSKDPSSFIVLFEDSAALVGLVLAAIGVWASHFFAEPRIDGAASILIGVVLAVVAIVLARESKGLIIGESADPALIRQLREVLEQRPEITAVNHVRTVHTAPEIVFVAVSADFVDGISMRAGDRGDGAGAEGDIGSHRVDLYPPRTAGGCLRAGRMSRAGHCDFAAPRAGAT
jgi:cation diffusion facilitator family transporter